MHHAGNVTKGDSVTIFELGLLNLHSIELGAIGRPEILNIVAFTPPLDRGVVAGDGGAGQHDDAFVVASYRDHVRVQLGLDFRAVLKGEDDACHGAGKKDEPPPFGKFSVEVSDANSWRRFYNAKLGELLPVPITDMSAKVESIKVGSAAGGSARAPRFFMLLAFAAILLPMARIQADEVSQVEDAVVALAKLQEGKGFDFRADIWERELTPDLGKAVRVQFFKGNEYRVCVAVPPKSGVKIAAHVLDMAGSPAESKIEPTEGGWGATLHVKPKRTGVYMVVIRHAGGPAKSTLCAMITGYK